MRRAGVAGRLKQLLRTWTAGDLVPESERKAWLGEKAPGALFERIAEAAGLGLPEELNSPPPRPVSATE